MVIKLKASDEQGRDAEDEKEKLETDLLSLPHSV